MRQKILLIALLGSLLGLLAGCQDATPICPASTATPVYLAISPGLLPTPTPGSGPRSVMIGTQLLKVDKVVSGPLCNDTWSGVVYVGCDVQVYPWSEQPLFLKDCQLNIDPRAVVYVAYHNNTAYYQGCSCHTGVTPVP